MVRRYCTEIAKRTEALVSGAAFLLGAAFWFADVFKRWGSLLIIGGLLGVVAVQYRFWRATAPEPAEFQVNETREFLGDFTNRQIGPSTALTCEGRSILWVSVDLSEGGPADFSARFFNVTGAVRYPSDEALDGYGHHVAWEDDSKAKVMPIPWRGSERLMLAWCFTNPHVLWFVVPESAAWGRGHGMGWPLRPTADMVEFDLEVIDHTGHKTEMRHGVVRFAGKAVADFTLTELLPTA